MPALPIAAEKKQETPHERKNLKPLAHRGSEILGDHKSIRNRPRHHHGNTPERGRLAQLVQSASSQSPKRQKQHTEGFESCQKTEDIVYFTGQRPKES